MPLSHVAVLAVLQGAAEALPVSGSAHGVVARIWLDQEPAAGRLDVAILVGTALGLAAAARRRLFAALGEGVRAIARPALFKGSAAAHDAAVLGIGGLVSLLAGAAALPRVELWSQSPSAAGAGLIVTGLALASTLLATGMRVRPAGPRPSFAGAVVVGVAHGLAVFPGASRVGAALTLLLWTGVRPERAVDLALLLTVPALLLAATRVPGNASGADLDAGLFTLGLVLAFVAAVFASEALRALAERRRVGALALWTIPLGLAMLAYAHALPRAA
jgi:undecaprenyl-diphosphatase